MTTDKIDGDTTAMSVFSQQLTPPPMPPSLGRLGIPPNVTGLFEGIAMSLLDKAATAEVAAYLAKTSEEFVTFTHKAGAAAAGYTAADVTSAAKLVSAGAKFAEQGVKLVRQVAGSQSARPAPSGQPEHPAGAPAHPSADDPQHSV